LYNAEAYLVII